MDTLFIILYLLGLGVLINECKTDDGIDLNVFLQNDYQVKFERLELVRYNKAVFKDMSIVTFKYNRTTAVVNITFSCEVDFGANVKGIVQAYKFMSNEYRTFPMRFAVDTCKAVRANVVGLLSGFQKCGNVTGCPFHKGVKYHVCNWYPDQSRFPPLIPDGQYKIAMQVVHFSQEVMVLNVYFTVFRPFV